MPFLFAEAVAISAPTGVTQRPGATLHRTGTIVLRNGVIDYSAPTLSYIFFFPKHRNHSEGKYLERVWFDVPSTKLAFRQPNLRSKWHKSNKFYIKCERIFSSGGET